MFDESFNLYVLTHYVFIILQDPEDLPFKRGDILYVISEDEEEWWTARNSMGQVGQIPVRYTQLVSSVTSKR